MSSYMEMHIIAAEYVKEIEEPRHEYEKGVK